MLPQQIATMANQSLMNTTTAIMPPPSMMAPGYMGPGMMAGGVAASMAPPGLAAIAGGLQGAMMGASMGVPGMGMPGMGMSGMPGMPGIGMPGMGGMPVHLGKTNNRLQAQWEHLIHLADSVLDILLILCNTYLLITSRRPSFSFDSNTRLH